MTKKYKKLSEFLENNKENDNIAVVHKERSYSYYSLTRDALRLSDIFCNQGNIGVFLTNSYLYVVTLLAVANCESTAVPIMVDSTDTEIESVITSCNISMIITDSEHYGFIEGHISKKGISYCILSINGHPKVYMNKPDNIPNIKTGIFILIHTSGSTSEPKRVALSQESVIENAYAVVESLSLSKSEVCLIALSMQYVSALVSQLISHLLIGAMIVIMETPFVPSEFLHNVLKYGVTNFTSVPTLLSLVVLRGIDLNLCETLKWICVGGAPVPQSLMYECRVKYQKVQFITMYGLTEAAGRLTHLLDADIVNSVGKPIPGISIRIINKQGIECDFMERGEVCVKTNYKHLGYYRYGDLSTESWDNNGWLHTGDIGYMSKNGYLYITGRIKNVIISGGKNIYPEEVEDVLLQYPGISGVYVYGHSDKLLGEVPWAQIVSDCEIDYKNLRWFCQSKLSMYKIPKEFLRVNRLGMTKNGKIKRI